MSFLAIDVGNTQIVFGVLDKKEIYMSCRLETDRHKTADEYAVVFRSLLVIHRIDPDDLEGGIISCVVPSLRAAIQDAVYDIIGKKCMIVGPGLKNGLQIRIDNPAQLGSDQVAHAVAVVAEYALPALIIDMGTATTVSVISRNGAYQGGMIMPGLSISLDSMISRTSLLPHISLADGPRSMIGSNTNDCIVSGMIYGTAAMLDGLVERLTEEIGEKPSVIVTGGLADQIIPYCRCNMILDKDLLLKGLRDIYLRNAV